MRLSFCAGVRPLTVDPAYPYPVCRTIQVSLMQRFAIGNLALLSMEHQVVVSRQETPRQCRAACSTQVV
jgi:hypothetical protein